MDKDFIDCLHRSLKSLLNLIKELEYGDEIHGENCGCYKCERYRATEENIDTLPHLGKPHKPPFSAGFVDAR